MVIHRFLVFWGLGKSQPRRACWGHWLALIPSSLVQTLQCPPLRAPCDSPAHSSAVMSGHCLTVFTAPCPAFRSMQLSPTALDPCSLLEGSSFKVVHTCHQFFFCQFVQRGSPSSSIMLTKPLRSFPQARVWSSLGTLSVNCFFLLETYFLISLCALFVV